MKVVNKESKELLHAFNNIGVVDRKIAVHHATSLAHECRAGATDIVVREGSVGEDDTTYLDYIKTSETKRIVDIVSYSYKIIESGSIIEIYQYKNERHKLIREKSAGTKLKKTKNNKKEVVKIKEDYQRKEQTVFETKRRLKRLINANVGQYETKDKFITLTFKDFLTRDEVIKCFKNFNKRLRYAYKDFDYQYIAVIEKGTRNTKRLHLHCLFFGLPYIPVIEFVNIWAYGTVDMKAINNYNDVASYILKYVSKTLEDCHYIGKGKKFYITSMKLKKPKELLLKEKEIEKYLCSIETKTLFETDFNSLYVGQVHYMKLRLEESI